MMLLCIAACVAPFVVFALLNKQTSVTWVGLLLCVVAHLVMFKMMPNHSCHSSEEKPTKQQASEPNDNKQEI